jgi:hypothetical protein
MIMRLIRNTTPDRVCKYGLIRFDKMRADGVYDRFMDDLELDFAFQQYAKYIEPQKVDDPEESFALKLKDKFAPAALETYANQWELYGDKEFAEEMRELARRARNMPNKKVPD